MRARNFAALGLVALALSGAGAGSASAAGATEAWQSPSGNIACAYTPGAGVACALRDSGRGAVLESFTGRVTIRRLPVGSRRLPVLAYGRTKRVGGTFVARSTRAGMTVRSTLSGRGFFISRQTIRRLP